MQVSLACVSIESWRVTSPCAKSAGFVNQRSVSPTLYPVLLLLSHLAPLSSEVIGPLERVLLLFVKLSCDLQSLTGHPDNPNSPTALFLLLQRCIGHSHHMTRFMTARVYAALAPSSTVGFDAVMQSLLHRLTEDALPKRAQNLAHGLLLAIQFLLLRSRALASADDTVSRLPLPVRDAHSADHIDTIDDRLIAFFLSDRVAQLTGMLKYSDCL